MSDKEWFKRYLVAAGGVNERIAQERGMRKMSLEEGLKSDAIERLTDGEPKIWGDALAIVDAELAAKRVAEALEKIRAYPDGSYLRCPFCGCKSPVTHGSYGKKCVVTILDEEIKRLGDKSDAEMERVKACEHIADGDEGWERLRDLCPSTAAVARLREHTDALTALLKEVVAGAGTRYSDVIVKARAILNKPIPPLPQRSPQEGK